MQRIFLLVILLTLSSAICLADQEASNIPHVVASGYGRCYAKSIPSELYGQAGTTKVFMVGAESDQLVHTFDWFSQQLYLECHVSIPGKPVAVSVVRFGPWARGHRANEDDLALAFYWDGALVASYSTLDIAGSPDNVSASVSHYTVIERVLGFESLYRNNETKLSIETVDGRILAFNAGTGRRIEAELGEAEAAPVVKDEGH